MEAPDSEILQWIESVVGPFRIVSAFAHAHAYSRLWRLKVGDDHAWLKMHAHPHKCEGEIHALTRWKAPLTPDVLGWREEPCAVLLSECPGERADEVEFSPDAEERLWSQAGDWLRRFHARTNDWIGEVRPDGSPGGRTRSDPAALAREGFAKRLQEGIEWGLLSAVEASFAQARFEEGLPSLEGATVHSIHRDFHPRNWLATKDGALTAVIDFEHARWDVRAADLNRPWDKEFHRNPRLIDAFYEAYGRPDERFMAQIQTMRLYNLVTGFVWAHSVGEAEFSDLNREGLRRMMDGSS